MPNIDESPDPTLSKSQYSMRSTQLKFAQEGDRRNTRELPYQRCDPCGELARTSYGNQNSLHLPSLEIPDHIVHCLAM
jgi:hypothetical protein